MRKRLGWRFNHRHNISDFIEHRADGLRYARRVLVTRPQNLVGYWPVWEGNGVVSFDNAPQGNHDGAYTGVTLAQLGIGDGRYSAFFDGVNDFNNIYSVALAAAWNGAAGTAIQWLAKNAGGGTPSYSLYIAADNNNRLRFQPNEADNTIIMRYHAGGVAEQVIIPAQPNDIFACIGMTWDRSAGANGEMRVFLNGVQSGATQVALGVWVGPLLASQTLIGARTTAPANLFKGHIGHTLLYDVALPPPEMAFLGEPLRM